MTPEHAIIDKAIERLEGCLETDNDINSDISYVIGLLEALDKLTSRSDKSE